MEKQNCILESLGKDKGSTMSWIVSLDSVQHQLSYGLLCSALEVAIVEKCFIQAFPYQIHLKEKEVN
jgi:hypothetical protein